MHGWRKGCRTSGEAQPVLSVLGPCDGLGRLDAVEPRLDERTRVAAYH